MSLQQELQRAGWDPFDPSEECRKVTELPAMPDRLREIDRLGIYHNYLVLRLFARFARGTKDGDPIRRQLDAIAVYFALRRTNLWEGLTSEVAEKWAQKIARWREEVLKPADERMCQADPNEVMRNPGGYEPAFTHTRLTVNMGIVDVERDAEMLSLGLAMHEEDSSRPKQPRKPATREELAAFHAFLTEQGNTIARISDAGMIEIDPLLVKKWMETRVEPVVQPEGHGLAEVVLPDPDLEEIQEALAVAEQVDVVRQIRDQRLEQAKEGSACWHVLHCFFELAQGDLSLRALSERVGISKSVLHDAFKAEREAIARALKAA
ncbi:MAG: hypothetical protein ACKVXR_15455 [Planctomycetota bacterium]